jgi:hypothetical protein
MVASFLCFPASQNHATILSTDCREDCLAVNIPQADRRYSFVWSSAVAVFGMRGILASRNRGLYEVVAGFPTECNQ